MRARTFGVLGATLVLGLAGGGAAAYVDGRGDDLGRAPTPILGTPRVPDRPVVAISIQPDSPDPAMATPTAYDPLRLESGSTVWRYPRPKGWTAECLTGSVSGMISDKQVPLCSELRWRPFDEEPTGGYSLRVKAVADDHLTPAGEVSRKLGDLRDQVQAGEAAQLKVIHKTDDALYVSIATRLAEPPGTAPEFLERLDFFHWYAAPGTDTATLEMSVAGRMVDERGLYGLYNVFGARVRTAG